MVPPGAPHEIGKEVDLLGNGKLLKKVVKLGIGNAYVPDGADVTVHYVGSLESNGTQFDSSRERGEPVNFPIGKGQVIKGWEKGLPSMKRGERAIFSIDHELAYGKDGKPPTIPPAARLLFDVEVLSWTTFSDADGEKGNGNVMKDVLVQGKVAMFASSPMYESQVHVALILLRPFKSSTLLEELPRNPEDLPPPLRSVGLVTLGDGTLPSVIETCVKTMAEGETSRFIVRGPGVHGNWVKEFGVTEAEVESGISALEIVLQLGLYTNSKTPQQVTAVVDKINEADKRRLEGNSLYTARKFQRAIEKYETALAFLKSENDDEEGSMKGFLGKGGRGSSRGGRSGKNSVEKAKLAAARIPILTNLATVQMEIGEYGNAARNCDTALRYDPSNVKALQKRVKALRLGAEFEAAREALAALKKVDLSGSSAIIAAEEAAIAKAAASASKKEKEVFTGMFDKLAAQGERKAAAKKAVSKPKELNFQDSVPQKLRVVSCSTEEAVGEYELNRYKLVRSAPVWERVGEEDPELAGWRIFSDPNRVWKLGQVDTMDAGLGYVKAKEVNTAGVMPHETKEWLQPSDDCWVSDTVTKIEIA